MAALAPQQQSYVVATETMWPENLKYLLSEPLQKACQMLKRTKNHQKYQEKVILD